MRETETRELPVKLTCEEQRDKGVALVQVMRAIEDLKGGLDRERARIKAQVDEREQEASQLQREIEDGAELRLVECEVGVNEEHHTWEVVRLDTGEVLESRPATLQELQRALPLEGSSAPKSRRGRSA